VILATYLGSRWNSVRRVATRTAAFGIILPLTPALAKVGLPPIADIQNDSSPKAGRGLSPLHFIEN
jgi:hypothetical protein